MKRKTQKQLKPDILRTSHCNFAYVIGSSNNLPCLSNSHQLVDAADEY